MKKNSECCRVSILGTDYTVLFDVPEEEMPEGADGCMDYSIKAIKIAKFEPSRDSLKNLNEYKNKVLRHEVIHAFLYESGMWNNSGSSEAWGQDETITDWIAIQFPKILEVFRELDCL